MVIKNKTYTQGYIIIHCIIKIQNTHKCINSFSGIKNYLML